MTPAEAAARGAALLGEPVQCAVRLGGGLLNHVFRLHRAGGRTAVLKHTPPHIAAQPSVPLDPERATFEAAALAWLAEHPQRFGAPRLIAQDGPTMVMSDCGTLPDLGAWLAAGGDPRVLDRLAVALRALHEAPGAPARVNRTIQQTRLAVQYQAIGPILGEAGVSDAAALGAAAEALGRSLLAAGPVFVMGDLWPPSVLVQPGGGLVLIDWEMCTRGQRGQDVAHLAAHLWLGAARGALPVGLAQRFVRAYGPVSAREARDSEIHFAAEILARTLGPFAPEGGEGAEVRVKALATACRALRGARSEPREGEGRGDELTQLCF